MKVWLSILIILLISAMGAQEEDETKKYYTKRVNGEGIRVDGYLNESAWSTVEWGGGDFTVRRPNEGEAPTAQTEFKILYDDRYIYIGIFAKDGEPEKIVRRMSRRDGFDGDWVEVNIDSYFDKQTAFSFTITAAGVKGDEFISSNGNNWDSSWDPIWFVETSSLDDGWIAEMKIPLSQLRFGDKAEQVWGIQFNRRIFRKDERSNWIFIPQNSNGWVHHFGELHGINGIRPQKQIELLPYSVGKQEFFPKEDDNPFADGNRSQLALGLDGKFGLTSDLTVDFTINPDFGQVEADPSEVNLSAFETFFRERRPFFIEGRNILDFQVTEAAWGGSYSSDQLFYSRRIGRRPQHYPDVGDNAFSDIPINTSIIGAAKLTGKTKDGWSIGVMESFTAEEKAEIDSLGHRREETVEPATNYLVGRVRKDLNDANTIIGGMFTAVNRDINSNSLNYLHTSAYTGGVDLEHNFKDRTYYVSGNVIMSQVRGDEEAILNTQTASARYYQRPDTDYLTLDSSRTSLSGNGGTIRFGKRGNFKFQTGATWRTPGVELNDIGFLVRADEVNNWTWVGYRISKPFGIFNSLGLNVNNLNTWDYGGNRLGTMLNHNNFIELKNFWRGGFSITHNFEQRSNSALRGGPAMKLPGRTNFNYWINSDQRGSLSGGGGAFEQWGHEDHARTSNYWLWLQYQPVNRFSISVNPWFTERRNDLQYITETNDQYLFGTINQKTTGLTMRFNLSITPVLTVEYYGSPFISAGEYESFKHITDPMATEYTDRFNTYSNQNIVYHEDNDEYAVDQDSDGSTDFYFGDPDFNFRDFNSNLVVRWEYSAGSTLFLVWSQSRNSFVGEGNFSVGNDLGDLFDAEGTNVFLIKFNRWFSL